MVRIPSARALNTAMKSRSKVIQHATQNFRWGSNIRQSQGPFIFGTIRYCSTSTTDGGANDIPKNMVSLTQRKEQLHQSLLELDIDAAELEKAAVQSIENPTSGYDGRYGKSAIRTYRSFVNPKKETNDSASSTIAAAGRCARQIEFLLKRHKSHLTEWVRHHDVPEESSQKLCFPLILILDNVRSAANVGSIFRTADAAGCMAVYTTGITPHPGGSGADKLAKSALGAEYTVPTRHFTTTSQAIDFVRKKERAYLQADGKVAPPSAVQDQDVNEGERISFTLIGMETTANSILYTDYDYSRGVALILGNEVTGVDTDILEQTDAIIEIPMFGVKNSLNIAACAPVVLYEIIRQWNKNI